MTTEAPAPSGCRLVKKPPRRKLTWDQAAGRACYACGRPLTSGAIPCGWAVGRVGVHVLDAEVWACP